MSNDTVMSLGLGDAILRLIHVEHTRTMGYGKVSDRLNDEREMLLGALNQIQLDLDFDCNNDGIPDTVEIFAQSVQTECCRLVPPKQIHTSRISRKRTSSRRAKK